MDSNANNKKNNKKSILRIALWSCFGVVCAAFLLGVFTFSGFFQPILNKYDPSVSALVEVAAPTDEWQTADTLTYSNGYDPLSGEKPEQQDYLEYRSVLAKRKVCCLFPGGDENVVVEMRIIDEDGNIVVNPLALTSATAYSINELDRNTKYTVQYRSLTPGYYTLQFE